MNRELQHDCGLCGRQRIEMALPSPLLFPAVSYKFLTDSLEVLTLGSNLKTLFYSDRKT